MNNEDEALLKNIESGGLSKLITSSPDFTSPVKNSPPVFHIPSKYEHLTDALSAVPEVMNKLIKGIDSEDFCTRTGAVTGFAASGALGTITTSAGSVIAGPLGAVGGFFVGATVGNSAGSGVETACKFSRNTYNSLTRDNKEAIAEMKSRNVVLSDRTPTSAHTKATKTHAKTIKSL
jgi:outer membrane lipoprotein SlyB